jgi:predicted DNA-binding transcriptional regulator YafY
MIQLRSHPSSVAGGQLVRERIWHPSQKIQETSDGGLELTLQLSSLHEIEPWVLSWAEHVRVLGPAELKKRVTALLKAALGYIRASGGASILDALPEKHLRIVIEQKRLDQL